MADIADIWFFLPPLIKAHCRILSLTFLRIISTFTTWFDHINVLHNIINRLALFNSPWLSFFLSFQEIKFRKPQIRLLDLTVWKGKKVSERREREKKSTAGVLAKSIKVTRCCPFGLWFAGIILHACWNFFSDILRGVEEISEKLHPSIYRHEELVPFPTLEPATKNLRFHSDKSVLWLSCYGNDST